MRSAAFPLVPGLAVAAVCGLVASAAADVVVLSDGSRLVGRVVRLHEGKITLETEYAGTLTIDASRLERIETDDAVAVAMDSGDRLMGQLAYSVDAGATLVRSELGDIPVAVSQIDAIWERDGKSPEALAMQAESERLAKELEAARGRWNLIAQIGLRYTDGNTETFTVLGGVQLIHRTPVDKLRFYVAADYAEDQKRRTRAEVKGGADYERLLTERLFAFAKIELEYDEFEDLELRLTTTGGPGYYWIKDPGHELSTRLGAGFQHESYLTEGRESKNDLILELGLDYLLELTPWMKFTHMARYYPTFEEVRDYRLLFDSALVFPIGNTETLKFKLGALFEYDSIPQPGRERLDQTYYGNFVIDIK
jgi:putative salt-induced outer membrane protein YdiY